jgi:predicted protein tyrosine phosphatase
MTNTLKIFQAQAPYNNSLQGPSKRLLFVCSVGLLRSPTCANVATKMGFNARSCGSEQDIALIPITANLIEWADRIIFMAGENFRQVMETFRYTGYDETVEDKAEFWHVDDEYEYGEQKLVDIAEYLLKGSE